MRERRRGLDVCGRGESEHLGVSVARLCKGESGDRCLRDRARLPPEQHTAEGGCRLLCFSVKAGSASEIGAGQDASSTSMKEVETLSPALPHPRIAQHHRAATTSSLPKLPKNSDPFHRYILVLACPHAQSSAPIVGGQSTAAPASTPRLVKYWSNTGQRCLPVLRDC